VFALSRFTDVCYAAGKRTRENLIAIMISALFVLCVFALSRFAAHCWTYVTPPASAQEKV
jgi:hypothetical protein